MHCNMYLLHGADTVTVNPVPSYLACQSKDLCKLTGTAQHLLLSTSALGDIEVMYTEAIPAPGKTGQTTGKR